MPNQPCRIVDVISNPYRGKKGFIFCLGELVKKNERNSVTGVRTRLLCYSLERKRLPHGGSTMITTYKALHSKDCNVLT